MQKDTAGLRKAREKKAYSNKIWIQVYLYKFSVEMKHFKYVCTVFYDSPS